MRPRARTTFLWLIVAQAAHSVEECVFRLYDLLPPARFVSSLFGDDPARGFAIANVLLVLAGLVCYAASVRPGRPSARGVAWFWSLLEFGNGVGHSILALARLGYFPGVATAPALLGISSYLLWQLRRDDSRG